MSLKKNTIWNLVGSGAPLLVGIFSIPYLVHHIGNEAFGILTLVWALIGYFSLFDFGLGRALTQQVASCLASGNHKRVNHLVKSGLAFTAITGLLGGVVLATLSESLGHSWLKVSLPLQDDTSRCLLIAAIGIPITTITIGLRGVIEAYEDFKGINLLRIILGIANFVFPVLCFLVYGKSLTLMVISLIIARFFVLFGHVIIMSQKLPKDWVRGDVDSKSISSLLSFGAWMTVSNIISPLMVTADRFVIAAVLGANVVAFYSVPSEVLIRVLILPGALTSALFPRLTSILNTDANAARELYNHCLKLIVMILAPICLLIAVLSHFVLTFWMGENFAEKSWLIVSIMSVGIFFNGIANLPFAAVQASGNSRITAFLHLSEFALYVPILFICLNLFGLIGAAIAWVIRVTIDSLILLIYAKKLLQ